MKRNEQILVYGVTGLLFVILFVAVVFGNEGTSVPLDRVEPEDEQIARTPEDAAKELADLLNLDPAVELTGGSDEESPETAGDAGPEDVVTPAEAALADLDAAMVAETPVSTPVPPTSRGDRIGNFRQVEVGRGDTFSLLVVRHTGSLDNMELVEALNEDVDKNRLRPGRKLLMPWVDDSELARRAADRRATVAATPDVAAGEGREYQVKAGDSLWKIASSATGDRGQVPGYIKRILAMNPDLVPERLRVGAKIRLPQN